MCESLQKSQNCCIFFISSADWKSVSSVHTNKLWCLQRTWSSMNLYLKNMYFFKFPLQFLEMKHCFCLTSIFTWPLNYKWNGISTKQTYPWRSEHDMTTSYCFWSKCLSAGNTKQNYTFYLIFFNYLTV